MGLFPDGVREGGLAGAPTLVSEPLLMNVEPGKSPNLGKAKVKSLLLLLLNCGAKADGGE